MPVPMKFGTGFHCSTAMKKKKGVNTGVRSNILKRIISFLKDYFHFYFGHDKSSSTVDFNTIQKREIYYLDGFGYNSFR